VDASLVYEVKFEQHKQDSQNRSTWGRTSTTMAPINQHFLFIILTSWIWIDVDDNDDDYVDDDKGEKEKVFLYKFYTFQICWL
jgi:hypothetical protein